MLLALRSSTVMRKVFIATQRPPALPLALRETSGPTAAIDVNDAHVAVVSGRFTRAMSLVEKILSVRR